ncbi:mandelate racemase/muconate lactonizing enzyme family protein [Kiloniella laminariae]|uniref:mandelate racemase/muconate lactonizing enzyme family protein n=1 Tax=Kiloniella laminariae TaxID=454162 RepID=UPI0003639B20|nr:mandelate racemase/muconate lactonizing enzyme family protein [Kiloniella laminariae]
MKIESIETFTNEFVSIVRVRTDEGHEGWGQVAPYLADITAQVVHRQVAPWLLGRDLGTLSLADLDAATDEVLEREHKFPCSYLYRALCGVDTALWDIRGKIENKSVCKLLGGTTASFPAYASSMQRNITPEQELARFQKLKDLHGYSSFKFRIGKECGHDQDQWPGRTEAIIPTIRKGLGDDVTLLVDANSSYSPPRAIEVGKLLQEHGINHFEEPCPYWELEWTKQVTDSLDIDVSGGEQDNYLPIWQKITRGKIVDIAQPDICYMGGITRTLRVVELAKQAGMPITLHAANLSLVTLFSLHMMGGISNPGKYLEFSIEGLDYYPWQNDIFTPGFQITDGNLAIPDTPGWGIELNPDWLARQQYQISRVGQDFPDLKLRAGL